MLWFGAIERLYASGKQLCWFVHAYNQTLSPKVYIDDGISFILQQYTESVRPLFVDVGFKLTAHNFRAMYNVEFSEMGSNIIQMEEDTLYCFETFLFYCEGNTIFLLYHDTKRPNHQQRIFTIIITNLKYLKHWAFGIFAIVG